MSAVHKSQLRLCILALMCVCILGLLTRLFFIRNSYANRRTTREHDTNLNLNPKTLDESSSRGLKFKPEAKDRKWDEKLFQELYPLYSVKNASCADILQGGKEAVAAAVKVADEAGWNHGMRVSPADVLRDTQNCDVYKTSRGYVTSALTQMEQDFPLAYSLVVFKDIEPVERLLRAIYRPQNIYCIHVDAKAQVDFFQVGIGGNIKKTPSL